MRKSRIAPTFRARARHSSTASSTSIPRRLSSWTRPGPAPRWRGYGRAPRVERLRMALPPRSLDDDHSRRLAAAFGSDHAARHRWGDPGTWFEAWVSQALAPTLRPADVVILDNLPAHKSAAARGAIEARASGCSSFRLTRPTSTRSRTPWPNPKPCYAKPLHVPSTISPARSAPPSTPSRQHSEPTTSPQPATMHADRKLLSRSRPG